MVQSVWAAVVLGIVLAGGAAGGVWYQIKRKNRLGMWWMLWVVFSAPLVVHKPINRFASVVFALFVFFFLIDVAVHAVKKPA